MEFSLSPAFSFPSLIATAVVVLEHHERLLVVCPGSGLVIADGVVENAKCALRRCRIRRVAKHSAQRRRPSGHGRLIFTPPRLNVKRVLAVAVEPLWERADERDAGLVRCELPFHGVGGARVLWQREEAVDPLELVDVAARDVIGDGNSVGRRATVAALTSPSRTILTFEGTAGGTLLAKPFGFF